ncbi:DUF177 domain-containing protein [Prochlorococcus sp. MIT 1307]|uniref:YceD family protein n=1 Tax=Prochlorococcus sp. MIT 1307 TaxID=3096219 RepID=UPI002A766395|nr:DUF177 domain-containing protein [Prochlorococcus sp. MIT 1307]
MSLGLQPIPLKELKVLSAPKVFRFEGYLDELPSLTPIRGVITAEIQGQILKIKGDINTIINLKCDRCLLDFNQILKYDSYEMLLIEQMDQLKEDFYQDEIVDHIDPYSEFDLERWVYEQLSLQMPLLKICSLDCKGAINLKKEDKLLSTDFQYNDPKSIDPRWSELKKLLKP